MIFLSIITKRKRNPNFRFFEQITFLSLSVAHRFALFRLSIFPRRRAGLVTVHSGLPFGQRKIVFSRFPSRFPLPVKTTPRIAPIHSLPVLARVLPPRDFAWNFLPPVSVPDSIISSDEKGSSYQFRNKLEGGQRSFSLDTITRPTLLREPSDPLSFPPLSLSLSP